MKDYKVKLITEEILEIKADGIDRGNTFDFYIAPDGRHSKRILYEIPIRNILYIDHLEQCKNGPN